MYAFCMKAPEPDQIIAIKSLGTHAGLLEKIGKVQLLGYKGKLKWQRTEDALEITCPQEIPFPSVAAFRIE